MLNHWSGSNQSAESALCRPIEPDSDSEGSSSARRRAQGVSGRLDPLPRGPDVRPLVQEVSRNVRGARRERSSGRQYFRQHAREFLPVPSDEYPEPRFGIGEQCVEMGQFRLGIAELPPRRIEVLCIQKAAVVARLHQPLPLLQVLDDLACQPPLVPEVYDLEVCPDRICQYP